MLYIFFFLSAGQRLILNIWKEKSASPMHVLHAGYGIGSFIVPLYSNPFLAVPMPTQAPNVTNTTTDNTLYNNSSYSSAPTTETTIYSQESRIQFSFAISASIVALLSLVFYYYQIKESCSGFNEKTETYSMSKNNKETNMEHVAKTQDNSTEKHSQSGTDTDVVRARSFREMFNPGSCSDGRTAYSLQLFVVLFIYFANAHGGERMVADFIRSFSIDQLGFSKDDGSYLNTTFWISFAVGRYAFFIAARWIGIRKLVLVEAVGIAITAVLMNIFCVDNPTAYWVLVQPLGFFVAPLWPSMMAWTDYHIELTGAGMALMILGAAVGGIAHVRLIGYLYDKLGYKTFLYQTVGYAILSLVLAIVLTLIGSQHGNRFKWNTDKKTDKMDPEPVVIEKF